MLFEKQMRWLRCAGFAVGLTCLAALCCEPVSAAAVDTTTAAKAKAQKKVVAVSPWEQAERGRETLESIPDAKRTKADYAKAIGGYRAIYYGNPADVHAAAAVNAVAELMEEQGRATHDAKTLKAAVGQYEFLRTQYPASSLRVQALLEEGQIEQNDLIDAAAAKDKYTLLLKLYGKSEQAEEAKAALASLAQGSGPRDQGPGKTGQANAKQGGPTHRDGAAMNGVSAVVAPAKGSNNAGASLLPPMAQTSGAAGGDVAAPMADERVGASKPPDEQVTATADLDGMPGASEPGRLSNVPQPAGKVSGKRALVTGIRHWSTATYTRVAIDLGDGVTYEAARVPNPDRIYFDLHGAKLTPELVGKSFTVTDDGFLKKVRAAQYSDDVTRIVLDVNDVTEYSAFLLPNPERLIIDIHGKQQGTGPRDQGVAGQSADVPPVRVASVVKTSPAKPVPGATAAKTGNGAEVAGLSDLPGKVEATSRPTTKPISAVVPVDLSVPSGQRSPAGVSPETTVDAASMAAAVAGVGTPASTKKKKGKAALSTASEATPARAAVPTADGETSLVRALGLKIGRIVIDAGHGGHDSGTLGVDGIQEKDVVLDVALRVGKLLHDRLGAEIIYTRSDDTFIPLETRTAIANKAQADLFLSIHANSSPDATARGVETYYLNFTSDPTALDVAARENAVSDQSIHQLSDLVKKIALKDKIAESREFATDVEGSLYSGLAKGNTGLKDRGVKKAPFVVLIGANMPSILAEISFVTNARDADQLSHPEYRQRVAESLYRGVAKYEGGLSGARVTTERAAGD